MNRSNCMVKRERRRNRRRRTSWCWSWSWREEEREIGWFERRTVTKRKWCHCKTSEDTAMQVARSLMVHAPQNKPLDGHKKKRMPSKSSVYDEDESDMDKGEKIEERREDSWWIECLLFDSQLSELQTKVKMCVLRPAANKDQLNFSS